MGKILLFTLNLFLTTQIVYSQKVDTLYFDKDGKGVEMKEFANYIIYAAYSKDAKFSNKFKIHYADTGELGTEGNFVSIDKYDMKNSIYDGEVKSYYKGGRLSSINTFKNGKENGVVKQYYENGHLAFEGNIRDGLLNGICTNFYETGLIHQRQNFIDGKTNGIYYDFSEDGNSCQQLEYKNGEAITPYLTHSTKDGLVTKYKLSDGSLFLEMPSINEKQVFHQNGTSWDYYVKNGLSLMVSASANSDYGKYYTLYIVLTNNSNQSITFNPSLITAYKTKKDKMESLKVLESSEYMERVSRRQNWGSFFNALNESMAASKAGYSASSTQTNSTHSGSTVSGVVGATVGTNGTTVGAAVGASAYNGTTATSSTTVNYNGAAAYQAQLIASNRIANYNGQLLNERKMKEEGYLKTTTVNSGESISGYINIKYEKGDELSVNIPINSIVYPFIWNIDN